MVVAKAIETLYIPWVIAAENTLLGSGSELPKDQTVVSYSKRQIK